MKNKVVLCSTVPDTFNYILRQQPHYLREYFDVSIISSSGNGLSEIAEREGVSVYPVNMKRGIHLLYDFYSLICMVTTLRRIRPDLIHSYTPKAGLIAMLAAWLCRVPIRIHTFTGLIFPTAVGVKKQVLIWVDRLICYCATQILPEGSGVRKNLLDYGITRKTLNVIGNGNIAGVDMAYFAPDKSDVVKEAEKIRAHLSISTDSFIFCYVGRLNRDKGIYELIRAFSNLPENSHLLLIGEPDHTLPVDNDTNNLIAVHQRIHALGFQSDIRPMLQLSDILVLPSYREGFPNVVLQAGAMTLPVIATDINGCNEVIESGFNGWLVPARDSLALQIAMQQSMQMQKSEIHAMGVRAKARIQLWFEQKKHWERMLHFYQENLTR